MRVTTSAAGSLGVSRIRSLLGHQAHYSARQEEILDALETVFSERGFRAVTVSDLAQAAQCARKTLYEIARSKEELFLLVLDRMFHRLGTKAQATLAESRDPSEQIETFLLEAVNIFKPPRRSFMVDVEAYAPAMRLFDDHTASALETVVTLVAAGVDSGRFRAVDPQLTGEVLAAAVTQVAGRGDSNDSDAEIVRSTIDLVLTGLLPR